MLWDAEGAWPQLIRSDIQWINANVNHPICNAISEHDHIDNTFGHTCELHTHFHIDSNRDSCDYHPHQIEHGLIISDRASIVINTFAASAR